MSWTYDLSTDDGKVRLLLRDTDVSNVLFEDDEIAAFLSVEGANVKRAAALGWETVAANEAYVQKVIKLLDLSTDGSKTAQALLARAKLLRDQAATEEANGDAGAFDIAEWVTNDFSARERLAKQALRGVL